MRGGGTEAVQVLMCRSSLAGQVRQGLHLRRRRPHYSAGGKSALDSLKFFVDVALRMIQEINAEMPYTSAIFKLIMWIRSSLSTLIHRIKFLKSGISNTKSFYRSYSMNNILKILLEVKVRKTLIEQNTEKEAVDES